MKALIDLTGRRFGRLVVQREDERYVSPQGQTQRRWLCVCDCGDTVIVNHSSLVGGNTQSCGCARKAPDITGRKFGRLTVVREIKPTKGGRKWECLCDCGKTVTVAQFALLQGSTQSCGCLRQETSRKTASHENERNPLQRADGTTIPLIRPGRELYKSNTSGVTGVYFDKSVSKWCAQIVLKGKQRLIGRFSKKEDAIAARKRAEEEYFAPIVDSFDAEREKENQNGN